LKRSSKAEFAGTMSIVDWFTGGTKTPTASVSDEEFEHLRSENAALRQHVEQARVIIERNASHKPTSPDTEAMEQHIESLERAHAEVIAQYETEHKERLKIETERNNAVLALQKAETEAKHAKNANAVLQERVEQIAQSAEEASDASLTLECAKDAEIVADEKQIGELVSRLNQMKVEQLALKRELASCSTTTQEAQGNLHSIHGFAMDVVDGFRGKNV
jgi:hypothetical protein